MKISIHELEMFISGAGGCHPVVGYLTAFVRSWADPQNCKEKENKGRGGQKRGELNTLKYNCCLSMLVHTCYFSSQESKKSA